MVIRGDNNRVVCVRIPAHDIRWLFSHLFADRRPKIKEKDAGNSPISKVAGTDLQSVALPHN